MLYDDDLCDTFDVGNGFNEFLSVGMPGIIKYLLSFSVFDYFAVMHDGDVVGNIAND